jgi:hypothetical protein
MNSWSPAYAVDTVNAGSNLLRASRPNAATSLVGSNRGEARSGFAPVITGLDDNHRRIAVTVNDDGPHEVALFPAGTAAPATLANVATAIQNAVRGIKAEFVAFTCASETVGGRDRLVATAPVPQKMIGGTLTSVPEASSVSFGDAASANAAAVLELGLLHGGRERSASALMRPQPTGTLGSVNLDDLDFSTPPAAASIHVNAAGGASPTVDLDVSISGTLNSPEAVRARVEAALHGVANTAANRPIRGATVELSAGRLRIIPGGSDPGVVLTFSEPSGASTTLAATLGLAAAAANPQRRSFGGGGDGVPPTDTQIRGSRNAKSGMYALLNVDLFNILSLPSVTTEAVYVEALALCKERRAFLLVDIPGGVDTVAEAVSWIGTTGLRDKDAAAYWPRVRAADPLQGYRIREFASSGPVAGVYARTDATRGVWKAPAGTDAAVRGAQGLAYMLTDPENGQLNPKGLNSLRIFPAYGTVVWGARTLDGDDQRTSPWKYVPVRRLALFIEESLYRGTQWVVFEPNDEPLWGQIRANVGAFMHNLFRQGAFEGGSAGDAYLVKCDSETTTQNDIDQGVVNILVGFQPLKPAEFVVLQITQLAGQVQA